jgi:hypothetical protein
MGKRHKRARFPIDEVKPRPQRIAADTEKLVPTTSYRVPAVYVDKRGTCRDCGEDFLFAAQEQQAWCERYGIPHYAERTRCLDCSQKRELSNELKKEYDQAVKRLNTDQSAEAYLDAARAAVLMATGSRIALSAPRVKGWLNACLKADPSRDEAYYWRGQCCEIVKDKAAAREAYETFCARTDEVKSGPLKSMRNKAMRWLESGAGQA